MKAVLCTPTYTRPHQAFLDAVEASASVLDAAGIEHSMVFKHRCPYISHARAEMLRQALDNGADVIVFIDHDMSWRPDDLVKLIKADADVASGLYRFKKDEEEYMGTIRCEADGRPQVRASDGMIRADLVPAGFLKVTRDAVRRLMRAYPELLYGDPERPSIDLFNHGARDGVWWGEDYAFSKRWRECGGEIWVIPDLNLDHHEGDRRYVGNFHNFMMRQPGGALSDTEETELANEQGRRLVAVG